MFSQFIHILNIWTILLSTVGIATYSHYCQDELKAVAFFVNTTKPCCKKIKACCKKTAAKCTSNSLKKNKSCCSSKKASSNYKSCFNKKQSNKTSFKKKNCCSDKKSYSQSDTETTLEQLDLDILFQYHFVAGSYSIDFRDVYYTFKPLNIRYAFLSFFPPPDIPLYILYQSFLC
jgi:hypothetical protein